jgi:hypothetical protein
MESIPDCGRGSAHHGRACDAQDEKADGGDEVIAFGAVEVEWTDRLCDLVRQLNTRIGFSALKNAIESKRFRVLEVYLNNCSLGFIIFRLDLLADDTRRFVVLHTLSQEKGRTPLRMISSVLLVELARRYACDSIGCYADRAGWEGILKKSGFEYVESVFVKEVTRG